MKGLAINLQKKLFC